MDGFPNSLAPRLAAAGCRRPEQAASNIGLLASDAADRSSLETILPTLLAALGRLPDPDLALNNLERFAQKVIDRHFLLGLFRDNPRILHLALTIFGSSQFLSDIVVRQPQLFEWLLEPGIIQQPKSKEELAQGARQVVAGAPTPERKWTALRRYKSQEVLQPEELSNLADVTLDAALEFCRSELVRRHGAPRLAGEAGRVRECAFVILGMGKLGGRELNFSSDIDLILLYEEDGETAGADGAPGRLSNQEFFRKLGEMLVRGMSESSPDGHLYRVDLRLRPEGRSGAIAASLRACLTSSGNSYAIRSANPATASTIV